MRIICPDCGFTREIDENKVPAKAQLATCPKCQLKFQFRVLEEDALNNDAQDMASETTPEQEAVETTAPEYDDSQMAVPVQPPAQKEDSADSETPISESATIEELQAALRAEIPEQKATDHESGLEYFEEPVEENDDPNTSEGQDIWQKLNDMDPIVPENISSEKDTIEQEEETLSNETPQAGYDPEQEGYSEVLSAAPQKESAEVKPEDDETDSWNENKEEGNAQQEQPVFNPTSFDDNDPEQLEAMENLRSTRRRPIVDVPFERLDKYGFFGGFYLTTRRALLSPFLFFETMPTHGKKMPYIYYTLMFQIAILFGIFWEMIGITDPLDSALTMGADPATLAEATNPMTYILSVLSAPAITAVSLLIASFFFQIGIKFLAPSENMFEKTWRAYSYAAAPTILCIIPFAGTAIGSIWSFVLIVIGLKSIHKTTYLKTLIALIVPMLVIILVISALIIVAMGTV
ncbi:MAG: YIP1 family protein [Desulfovibrio sp.]